jgi:uncharacterized protein (DUF433 family)
MVRNMGSPDMERVKSDRNLGTNLRPKGGKPVEARVSPIDRTNPRSRRVNRSARASEFAAFANDLRCDLNPRGPLERLMADHVVHSAWRLKGTLDRQAARNFGDKPDLKADSPKGPASSTADRAARSVRDALESLDYLQTRRVSIVPIPAPDVFEPDLLSNEWPIVPSEDFGDDSIEAETQDDEIPNWRDRLVFDFDISDISPVVKGTWITVGHVVSLIVDGWTWADILRSHPELGEEDIRTCIAYAMAEENATN